VISGGQWQALAVWFGIVNINLGKAAINLGYDQWLQFIMMTGLRVGDWPCQFLSLDLLFSQTLSKLILLMSK
jgi:hypothetical protein